jgi:hypothetical protein
MGSLKSKGCTGSTIMSVATVYASTSALTSAWLRRCCVSAGSRLRRGNLSKGVNQSPPLLMSWPMLI